MRAKHRLPQVDVDMHRDDAIGLITGVGLITPLGADATSNFHALLDGSHLTTPGRIEDLNTRGGIPRVSTLAMTAALEAISQAGWDRTILQDETTALVVGTSKGPVDSWLRTIAQMQGKTGAVVRAGLALSRVAEDVATAVHLGHGARLTVSAACASGLHALARAMLMLRTGECQRAIVVAAESSLHDLFMASFERLGVLAKEGAGCRPFDRDRSGFVISEAAAAVCLEFRPQGPALVGVQNVALGCDAQHLTAGSADGRVLRHLLGRVIGGQPVDLIHAHGTGTVINDPIELAAIDDGVVCHDTSVYSHKAAIGHSLGASGLVSVVLNCLMHQQAVVLPNVQTQQPIAARRVRISQQAVARSIGRSVAIAAGFGGAAGGVSLMSVG